MATRRKVEKSATSEARENLDTLDGVLAAVPLDERTRGRVPVAEVAAAERELGERFPEPFRRILLEYGPLAAVLPRRTHSLYSPSEVVAETREARAMSVSPAHRRLLATTVFVQHINDWTSDRVGLTPDGRVVLQDDEALTVLDETFDARLRALVVGGMHVGLEEALAAPKRALHLRFEGNVPDAVGTLANLEVLDVWPKDGRLPPSAGNLLRLRELVVHGVALDEIPEEVLSLPRLRTISVYGGGTTGRRGASKTNVQPKTVEALLSGFAKSGASRETRALHFSLLLGRWDRVRSLASGTMLAEAKKSNVAAVRAAADRVLSEAAPKKKRSGPLADAAKVDPEVIERLRELLASPDAGNQRLAIAMLKTGGVPDGMLEELLMFTFESSADWATVPVDAKARDDMRKVLAEISPKATDAIKRVVGRGSLRKAGGKKARAYLAALGPASDGAIDTVKLARLMVARWKKRSLFLFEQGGDIEREALRSLLESDGRLNLAREGLSTLPDAVRHVEGMRALDISGNDFRKLPPLVIELTQLEGLDLSGNDLVDLPLGLTKLTRLTSLDISTNRMKDLPSVLPSLTSLRELNVGTDRYNRCLPLQALPEALSRLTALTKLGLGAHEIAKWPSGLRGLTKLATLDLSATRPSKVPRWLAELPALAEVDLTGAEDTDGSLIVFRRALEARGVRVKS